MLKLKKGEALILKTVSANMCAHGGFRWPKRGLVKAPDWRRTKECGNGLHGWLWGEGDGGLGDWSAEAKWVVARVRLKACISLGGKVKFPRAYVVFAGSRQAATAFLAKYAPKGSKINGGTATAGDGGTATAGDRGTATAGDRGTATAGDMGTATAGYMGTATAGYMGSATAGYGGTATAGYRGTATAGDRGTATAGDRGTATAGDRGTATAGDGGSATAGESGSVLIRYYDGIVWRWAMGACGQNIKPNTAYTANEKGELIEAQKGAQ